MSKGRLHRSSVERLPMRPGSPDSLAPLTFLGDHSAALKVILAGNNLTALVDL
ncbi:unnamed protein product, partial [Nesidiocoris tenuis]